MIQQSYVTPITRKGWRFYVHAAALRTLHAVNRLMRLPTGKQAIHSTKEMDWVRPLEAAAPKMRTEIERLVALRREFPDPIAQAYGTAERTQLDWFIYPLYWLEKPIEATCACCPETYAALQKVPGLRTASFSLLGPHQHIALHEHPFLTYFVFHVGIVVPKEREKCRMQVLDQVYHWKEGEVLVFDPTFPHEVWNESDELRIALVCEKARPHPFPLNLIDRAFWNILKLRPWDRKPFAHFDEWTRRLQERMAAAQAKQAQ